MSKQGGCAGILARCELCVLAFIFLSTHLCFCQNAQSIAWPTRALGTLYGVERRQRCHQHVQSKKLDLFLSGPETLEDPVKTFWWAASDTKATPLIFRPPNCPPLPHLPQSHSSILYTLGPVPVSEVEMADCYLKSIPEPRNLKKKRVPG